MSKNPYCPRLNPEAIITEEICRIGKFGVDCLLKSQIACCFDCGYKDLCRVVCSEVKRKMTVQNWKPPELRGK